MSEQFPPPQDPDAPVPAAYPQSEELVVETAGGKKTLLVAGSAALAVAVVAGAAFAAVKVFSGDENVADSIGVASAMPSNTLAMAAVSLDPEQVKEAVDTLNKFPGFADNVEVSTDGDVIGDVIDSIIESEQDSCGLTYEADFKPWLGSSAGVGILPEADGSVKADDDPRVFAVLETVDADKAQTAFDKFNTCADGANPDDGAWTFVGNFAVLAENEENLGMVTNGIEAGTLADSDTFQTVMATAGEAGFASVYLSPEIGGVLVDLAEQAASGDIASGFGSDEGMASDGPDLCKEWELSDEECELYFPDGTDSFETESTDVFADFCPSTGASEDEMAASMSEVFESFPGGAAVARFKDGGLEFETGNPPTDMIGMDFFNGNSDGAKNVTSLPGSTAAVLGVSVPEGWLDSVTDYLTAVCGGDFDAQAMWDELSAASGLDMPTDLKTLVGNSISVSLGGSFDLDAITYAEDPMSEIPFGIKIGGDAAGIQAVLQKLIDQMPEGGADFLDSEVAGDYVVLAPQDEFQAALVAESGLGDTDEFKDVVPNADDAAFVFYINANAFDDMVADGFGGSLSGAELEELVANYTPLKALGYSGWSDDKGAHVLFRISTD